MIKSGQLRKMLGGIAPATLEKWIEAGEFPQPIKIGRANHWHLSEVRAWIAKQPRRKAAA